MNHRRQAFESLSETPCANCLQLAYAEIITREMVMPLPDGPAPPLLRSNSTPCCRDCSAADGLRARQPGLGMTFEMARLAIGNDRAEHLRMPLGMSQYFGLVKEGYMDPCSMEDLSSHYSWLEQIGLLEPEESSATVIVQDVTVSLGDDGMPISPVPCFDECGAMVEPVNCREGWGPLQLCDSCRAKLDHTELIDEDGEIREC